MKKALLVILSLALSACAGRSLSPFHGGEGGGLVPIAGAPSVMVEERVIPREILQKAASSGGRSDAFRMVEVYRRNQEFGQGVPEYRLFDVAPGSVLESLGLRNGDVLRGANGYAIFNVAGFREFSRLLVREDKVSFDIVRSGQPIRLAIQIR